ncbi:hypothetical protein DOMOVOI_01640 [Brevundimonas phage vB_BpoS-Domovoi]|uniref:Uncharacterized protein n=1 Tax=Brevundimonas phage vB_BpoS-Domovoi TaxID=2948598 RepID=A0A9E7MQS9_9CAUD|nr:hypothetical protein DOMOVOI_01640 [Brevundimonas phage vB_BpoS-Domovoi]
MTYMTIGQVGAMARGRGMVFSRTADTYEFRLRYRDPTASNADGRAEWITADLQEIIAVLRTMAPFEPPPAVTIPRQANFSNNRACSDLEPRDKRSASDY